MNFPTSFIKATEKYSTAEEWVPAPYFRQNFEIKEDVNKAELLITGLGYYEVYINGENITKGFLAPYRSNPDHYIYFDSYDLSQKLKKGKNVIGVLLGNGMRNSIGGFIWEFDKAPFRGAPITAFSLDIEYANGNTEGISSGTDTLTAPSPIIFDDVHLGEYYDARLETEGWNLPDFDDSNWSHSLNAEAPRGECKLCEAEPILPGNKYKPVSVTKFEDSYIYDFGVNSAGICSLKIKGDCGQKILLQYFESIVNGKPYILNSRFHAEDRYQEDEFYCSGNGTDEYTPHFTYHGFRYVLVTGITEEQATEDLLTYIEMSSALESAGSFTCNDETINKIQEAILRSDISNFYYFPTDCPQREKNGWTADASLSAEQMLLNITPENSYKEWLRNIYKAINDKGQLPGIVPTGGWGYHWGNGPAWDNVIVNLPYYTYKYRGDRQILEELAVPLMRYLDYLYSRLDEKDLIAIGLGDWCQPSRNEGDYDTPLVVTDTILTFDIAKKAEFIFEVLGKEPQRDFARTLAQKIKTAFREHLIDKNTLEVEGKTQTAQAMALYYGMFDETEKSSAFEILLKYIDDTDGHFNTGVLGGRILYRLLSDCGYTDLAYNMIVRPDFPSYGNWIKRRATTLFECFFPEGGRIASLNHHFWGDVSAWFYIYLAGIRVNPTCRDCTNIDIKPCFTDKIKNVSAAHKTPYGEISVKIEQKEQSIVLEIESAPKLHGKIELPHGYQFEDGTFSKALHSGKYIIMCCK